MFKLIKYKKKAAKTERQKIKNKLDALFSKKVRERDRVCQKCGKSKTIYCHHIFSRSHTGTRWDMDNGISLCVYCHNKAHNDAEAFRDWVMSTWMRPEKYMHLKIKAFTSTKFTVTDLEWIRKELAA